MPEEDSATEVEALLGADPRWQLMSKVVASADFVRSPKLSEFLRYVTRMTLAGQSQILTEHHVGEVIFGRPPSFDSAADTVVRSTALRLRRRLEEYFVGAGADEQMLLGMPRGSYSVVFIPRMDARAAQSEAQALQTFPLEAPPVAAPERIAKPRLVSASVIISALLLGAALVVLVVTLVRERDFAHAAPPTHLLWSEMFTPEQPTRIVLGDSGLVLFHAVTHQYISLDDYLHHRFDGHLQQLFQVDPKFALFLTQRRYTSMTDASAQMRLTRLPQATPDQTLVQYSRDMRLDDFRNANVILLGAQEADPWVELFERSMDFVFQGPSGQTEAAFLNRHPAPGERSEYRLSKGNESRTIYAVIAFLPNLDHSGNVLILEGINMAGTGAALNLILDDSRLLPVLRALTRPDGTLQHFEMLVKAETITDSATPAQVVSIHRHR